MRIVALSGGLRIPSSSRTLAVDLAEAARSAVASDGGEAEIEIIDLRDHAQAIVDAMLTGFPGGEFAEVVERVTTADALVVVSPTFSAGMSGLAKSFFDVLEPDSLESMPVLLAATGGTERHSLVIEYAMRPLFTYLKAAPVGTGVYAATSDFGGDGAPALRSRVDRAGRELADAMTGTARRRSDDDFVDFETLLARR